MRGRRDCASGIVFTKTGTVVTSRDELLGRFTE